MNMWNCKVIGVYSCTDSSELYIFAILIGTISHDAEDLLGRNIGDNYGIIFLISP